MLTEDGKNFYVSYREYDASIEVLAKQIYQSNWNFDAILCLARGGFRPGDILSRIFNKPLAIMSASSYREKCGFSQGELKIAENITAYERLYGNILLVDDMVDSGKTLLNVSNHLKQITEIKEFKTAVIWQKSYSIFQPDYFTEVFLTNPWIHQPFEIYDEFDINKLK